MRMGRAGGLLVDGRAEEHLRIGALEDAGDAGEEDFFGSGIDCSF